MTLIGHHAWRTRAAAAVILGIASAAVCGCLTMRRGSLQVISVESAPPGATVHAEPSIRSTRTPGQLALARRFPQSLRFEKEGFETKQVFLERKASSGLWRNAVWIHPVGWIIGVVVDLSSGSGYNLKPDSVSVELRPLEPEVKESPPDS